MSFHPRCIRAAPPRGAHRVKRQRHNRHRRERIPHALGLWLPLLRDRFLLLIKNTRSPRVHQPEYFIDLGRPLPSSAADSSTEQRTDLPPLPPYPHPHFNTPPRTQLHLLSLPFAMAFVGSPAALPSAGRAVPRLSARSSAFVAAAAVVRSSTTAAAAGQTRVVSMATPPRRNRSKFDDNKVASTYDALGAPPAIRSGPGWTPGTEILNGRLAMMGFILGLGLEQLTGASIYSQLTVPWELLSQQAALSQHLQF